MSQSAGKMAVGATPGRLALIGVLAVVLVVVLVVQFGGRQAAVPATKDSAATAQPQAENVRPARSSKRPARPQPEQQLAAETRRQWPQFDVQQVRRHNPFLLADELTARETPSEPAADAGITDFDARREQREQLVTQLTKDGVGLVLLSERHQVATIGRREIRVGDRLNGLLVTEIRPDGVVLIETEVQAQ